MTGRPLDERRGSGRPATSRAAEAVATPLVIASGWAAIVILAAIAVFLFVNALPAFSDIGLVAMLRGAAWFPTGTPPEFGFLPAIVGSLWVTIVALLVSVPLGITGATYISEFSGGALKDVLKSVVEFLAAVPSVVYGLLGLAVLSEPIRRLFGLPSGLNALVAGIVVGIMALPTVLTISEDALHAVPEDLRQGSLALGNTRWQTVRKVVVPAASSGIFAATMLGVGRAMGETMVVLLLAGNAGVVPRSPFLPVSTLPGTIAGGMGEVAAGSSFFYALFAMGLVLFAVTFVINLAADVVLERQRRRWRR
jgi:phosphate transport system permease protein